MNRWILLYGVVWHGMAWNWRMGVNVCVCVITKTGKKCLAMSTVCTGSLQTRLQRVAASTTASQQQQSNSKSNGC